jgi:hypothetical protein
VCRVSAVQTLGLSRYLLVVLVDNLFYALGHQALQGPRTARREASLQELVNLVRLRSLFTSFCLVLLVDYALLTRDLFL